MAVKLVKNCKEFLENSDIVCRPFCCVVKQRKGGNTMPLLSVTYGKYATQVPIVVGVAYEYYECFSSQ